MNSIVTVTTPYYGECKLDVNRIIALEQEKKKLLFESTCWILNQEDFDKVYELWHALKGK